ncbi:hypothetical protein E4T56_gene12799 [Termitomyces sp. T112]|nr:hypothetical protein E4T56_gene12799 [Termitomyces sp. T112]
MPTMPVYLPLLDDPRHQLVELEAEILRVETLLSKLVQRRILLKRDIIQIFTMCLPSTGSDSSLLQVCSAWCHLARSMPWL